MLYVQAGNACARVIKIVYHELIASLHVLVFHSRCVKASNLMQTSRTQAQPQPPYLTQSSLNS